MRKSIYIAALLLCTTGIIAQTTTQNYILTKTYQDASASSSLDVIQYFDGLGRPVETVQKGVVPTTGADLVSLVEYDDAGRQYKNWLPIAFSGNSGAYVAAATITGGSPKSYYNYDSKPYATTEYEASPLNRVTGQYGVGNAWYANSKKTSTAFQANAANEVGYYFVNSSIKLERNSYYAANTLYKTVLADEDGKTSTEYKDKLGRVVMKRSDTNVDTYFVYNDLGQLSYVLPPIATDSLPTSGQISDDQGVLQRYAYLYKYDERGNNVVKRLPGCDSILMVYDKADRLILSQDGNQRAKPTKQWTISKYDALGRVVYTGLINRSNSRTSLAAEIKDLVITEQYDSINTTFYNTGYTCNYFVGEVTPILVNYYDNYHFVKKNNLNLAFSTQVAGYTTYYPNAKGLPTGSRTYILDKNITQYTANALYYDDRGRVVQNRSTNFLGGKDNIYTAYDFTGKVTSTYKEHSTSSFSNFPEQYSYTYDQAGRLLVTNCQYGIMPSIVLSSNKYDELGRLITTYRHNATDSVKYEYNVRNWITKLKSGSSFEENLYYNSSNFSPAITPCYNGNIAATTWTYNGAKKAYVYTYNELNRLTLGTGYQTSGNTLYAPNNKEQFEYDKQGNIQRLWRDKEYSGIDFLQMTYAGNQLQSITDGYGSQGLYSVKEYQNKSNTTSEFAYDENGNMDKDLDRDIVTIRYNLLNLPDTIQFKNGNVIINRYDAAGQKMQSDYYTRLTALTPIGEGQVLNPENGYSDVTYSYSGTAYIGNMEYSIYKNKSLGYGGVWVYSNVFTPQRMYNAEGYVDNLTTLISSLMNNGVRYNYFRKDHLGNNREVWNGVRKNYSGTIKEVAATRQRTQYYPSGLPWASNTGDNPSVQSKKFIGKEFIEMHGYDCTDLGARVLYNAGDVIPTPDPLMEKYYSISPYSYCAGNPVNRIDPDGMDWFQNSQTGAVVYVSDLHRGAEKDMEKGWEYMGANNMFMKDEDDITNSDQTLAARNGGDTQVKENNPLTHADDQWVTSMLLKGDKAKDFMQDRGYDFKPTQQIRDELEYDANIDHYKTEFTIAAISGEQTFITEKSGYVPKGSIEDGIIPTKPDKLLYLDNHTVNRFQITYTTNAIKKAFNLVIPNLLYHDFRIPTVYSSPSEYPWNNKYINLFLRTKQ